MSVLLFAYVCMLTAFETLSLLYNLVNKESESESEKGAYTENLHVVFFHNKQRFSIIKTTTTFYMFVAYTRQFPVVTVQPDSHRCFENVNTKYSVLGLQKM